MTWYLVAKPLLAITEVRHFLYLATRFAHISGGILSLSSLQILSKSLRVRLATRTFSSLHRFSMGLMSGDWLGHSKTFICLFLSRGTLRVLQDFSPSWRNVCYQLFSWWLCPSCLEIIDKILLCSSGLIPHRSHNHLNSTRWDLAWSTSPWEIDSCFVFLPFANNRTNCCHLLVSCSPFLPCVYLQSCSWHLCTLKNKGASR